ncbi:peptide-methionine (R)-S-oxide reductase MsrB [Thiohalocapsa marina]|uniref:Peptide methionine sulfoxide reductase MsrB n=1 Tax=Thiohalocapsa marina TaxID=424902 RepID=A0A5M8FHK3_9GAMM|nr:peptide-methionine (R)-S-oxide reductase MsrB [Thiohalocapsa marina]KAA6183430.1 peptide-methionine (R)-S-oxide reductase MsrB [Thiohalocapsa marina]
MSEKIAKTDTQWREQLTAEQFRVCRQQGTEPAFSGAYHASKSPGQYRCVCCGADLFSSAHKYDSGSGWPSFWQPSAADAIGTECDRSHGMVRTEVHCSRCGSHLGHVFPDGPEPTGLRYCINSVSLDFQPDAD